MDRPEQQTSEEILYVKGMRDFEPSICWRYLPMEGGSIQVACILQRGHDNGEHEPPEDPK